MFTGRNQGQLIRFSSALMNEKTLHILLVDDDPTFRALTELGLREHGFVTSSAEDGETALTTLSGPTVDGLDLVLLDIMMPKQTGWDVLKKLRNDQVDVPVIMVTARESVEERVRGLQMGADDYIIKPFAFAELLARIEAVVRRRSAVPELRLGRLNLNPVTRQVKVGPDRVEFSPKEFDVLRALLNNRDAVQSRARLLEEVWHTTEDPGTNIVEVHIGRIRKKLEAAGCHFLKTVRGKGYALVDSDA